ncbi:MAG: hypothetical protein JO247_10590, partial [Chloroflexi bacterium]|nr:hypothetical protein [Chloroflexota bacterium]
TLTPGASISAIASALTGTAPASTTATFTASGGGIVLAGNVGIAFPPGAFGALAGNVTVQVTANPPSLGAINAGGPSQFSPNGTILDINIRDANNNHITTFPQAITVVTKPNAADLTLANNNINSLTLAFVVDADSPALENPNSYPINTLVIEPPSAVVTDPVGGTVSANLNALGSVIGVVTNPVGYVQTLNPAATEYSSFDPNTSQQFSSLDQFTSLQVVEPQIGNRLLVIDPTTNNFAYVNASDVAPSGPPPAKSSAAVVQGILQDAG